MVPLLDRLAVEVGRELRQRLRVVVDGDRDVLLRGAELVRDLLVERVREAGHARILLRAAEHDAMRWIGPKRVRARRSAGPSLRGVGRTPGLRLDVGRRRAERDAARLRLRRLGDAHLEHAVGVLGGDAALVDPGRQRHGAAESPVRRSKR